MSTTIKPNWSALAALARTLVILGSSTFVGAIVLPLGAGGTIPDSWAAWRPVLAVAASACVAAELLWIRLHLQALAASMGLPSGASTTTTVSDGIATAKVEQRGFARLAPVFALAFTGLLAVLLSGCLTSAPIVPVTPANQAQVTSCQSTASFHDGIVIGDFAFGGIGAGLATAAAAVTDSSTKTGLAVAGAGVGGLLIAGTALAELTASNFANSQCSSVVGSLPTSPAPAAGPRP